MDNDTELMLAACVEAAKCTPSQGAFSVGAICVTADGRRVTGFSRELDAAVHAEEAAIRKAATEGISLKGATMYTTMEPCSVRLSGRTSCCERLLEAAVTRVVVALKEPLVFVKCEGTALLESKGVVVDYITDPAVLAAAAAPNAHLESPAAAVSAPAPLVAASPAAKAAAHVHSDACTTSSRDALPTAAAACPVSAGSTP